MAEPTKPSRLCLAKREALQPIQPVCPSAPFGPWEHGFDQLGDVAVADTLVLVVLVVIVVFVVLVAGVRRWKVQVRVDAGCGEDHGKKRQPGHGCTQKPRRFVQKDLMLWARNRPVYDPR